MRIYHTHHNLQYEHNSATHHKALNAARLNTISKTKSKRETRK